MTLKEWHTEKFSIIKLFNVFNSNPFKDIFLRLVENEDSLHGYINVLEEIFVLKYQSKKISVYAEYLGDLALTDKYTSVWTTYLYSKYFNKWDKMTKLLKADYDILKPFNITLSENKTDNLDVTKDTSSSTYTDSTYGFNSSAPAPTDSGTNTNSNEYSRVSQEDREYTRAGNIGNSSYSELIEKEREQLKFIFLDTLFSDIVGELTRNKY